MANLAFYLFFFSTRLINLANNSTHVCLSMNVNDKRHISHAPLFHTPKRFGRKAPFK